MAFSLAQVIGQLVSPIEEIEARLQRAVKSDQRFGINSGRINTSTCPASLVLSLIRLRSPSRVGAAGTLTHLSRVPWLRRARQAG